MIVERGVQGIVDVAHHSKSPAFRRILQEVLDQIEPKIGALKSVVQYVEEVVSVGSSIHIQFESGERFAVFGHEHFGQELLLRRALPDLPPDVGVDLLPRRG